MKKANKFVITGRLISSRKNEDGTGWITIYTKNGIDIYAKIFCPKEIFKEMRNRSHVVATGYIKEKWNASNHRNSQKFIAETLEYEKTITEEHFGEIGKFYKEPNIQIFVSGTVRSTMKKNGWYLYAVIPDGDTKDKRTQLLIEMKELDRHPNVRVGDKICAVCSLSTPRKTLNDKTVYFENIIVSDLAVITDEIF
jgi:hypothetical protein